MNYYEISEENVKKLVELIGKSTMTAVGFPIIDHITKSIKLKEPLSKKESITKDVEKESTESKSVKSD